MVLRGWGRVSCASVTACMPEGAGDAIEAICAADERGIVVFGGGRSYGDAALNSGGRTVLTARLNRIQSFDPDSGVVVCEPGVTFHDLLQQFLPRGYIVPASPGTGFASIGGAVANDIHGKNHDRSGSFGDHVRWIDLLLPSGEVVRVSPDHRPDLFAATIGGIGLTGIMLRVCFTMQRMPSNAVALHEEPIRDLDSFFEAFDRVRATATFSVGWIDALARGVRLGRGILETAEPAPGSVPSRPPRRFRVPQDLPGFVLNPWTVRGFNHWYYHRVPATGRERLVPLERFLYPLDTILEWNRLYGKGGFYQFQSVFPDTTSPTGIRRLVEEISRFGYASFLAVLKTLGGEGRGYLSFPMRGYTLALDFSRKPGTEKLLARLERITLDHGGRIYLAKDACLSRGAFEAMYPKLDAFRAVLDEVDPLARMSSDMSRRLGIRGQRPKQVDSGKAYGSFSTVTSNCEQQRNPLTMIPQSIRISNTDLLTVEDAKKLTVSETADLFCKHMNPGQYHYLKLLGFHEVVVETAEGMYYTDKNGQKILDFFGGFGSLAFGHNHPRILATRKRFQEELRHEIAIAFMSQYASALAKNLASIAPEDLDMVFLGSTGSEVNEAALKLAEKAQGPDRATIAYAEHSFHGKSRGALSVTDSDFYQSTFRLLDNRVRVPFGDSSALEAAFKRNRSIGVLILETVQGGAGIVVAPPGYWKEVRSLCDRYNVLWIADEVQCGVGRTGRFFAFEYEGVVPDIITLAKSLGGGKSAMGAMVARRPIYMKAYGTPKSAMIHGPATFGGIGEACCTAIEALNILYDEGLIENAAVRGAYLLNRLQALRTKYPKMIKEVRGQGLMIGIEFCDVSQILPLGLGTIVSVLDEKLKGSLSGFVGSLLLKEYNILVAFTEYNRNVIRLEPPLIVTPEQIDTFADALDNLLSRGIVRIVTDYTKNFLRKG
jgi:Ornithine/acetylornithine aminotransferase